MPLTFISARKLRGLHGPELSDKRPTVRFCTNSTICREAYRNGDMVVGYRVYGHPKSMVTVFYCSLCSRDIRTGEKMSRPNRSRFSVISTAEQIDRANLHRLDAPKPKASTDSYDVRLCKDCGRPFTRTGYTVERGVCLCANDVLRTSEHDDPIEWTEMSIDEVREWVRTRLPDTKASESKPKAHGKVSLKG